jgi:RNA polymerase II elongation factor ELL
MSLHIPSDGVTVHHRPRKARSSEVRRDAPQVLTLALAESLSRDILRALKNNEQVRLRCGKALALQLGKKTVALNGNASTFPSELFTKSTEDGSPFYFTGKASHSLEVSVAEEDTAKADEALATLQSTLKSISDERASNEASLKEETRFGQKKGGKPTGLLGHGSALRKDILGGLNKSTPGSPFLSATYSPRLAPTSAPLGAGMSTEERIRLDAIRIPLIHLLAVRTQTPKSIREQLNVSKDELEKLLDKVSKQAAVDENQRSLKDKIFRELDVWKFPYRSSDDREAAVNHAIHAFDRLRIEKRDPLWQQLLPVSERGKGKILSRLNFDKPVITQVPKGGEDSHESKAEMSDRERAKSRKTKSEKESAVLTKPRKDHIAGVKATERSGANIPLETKERSKAVRSDGKFKSAERIEDSDEDVAVADETVVKPSKNDPRTIVKCSVNGNHEREKPRTADPPRKAAHKASLSRISSSSSNNGGIDKSALVAANNSKSLKPQSQHKRTDSSGARISPRPRHDSSPQKPSPLGSSPPTTSTDVENSSSSKASNQSSAPSSPPSSTDMPQTRAGNKYSPIISDQSRNVSRGRSPGPSAAKRKQPPTDDERPSKRHQAKPAEMKTVASDKKQITNGTAEHPILNGSTNSQRTESERSSSPEKKPPNRDDIIEDGRRFQQYYKRYKDLHDRINQIEEKDRDSKDMENLWRMHKRLKEMKSEIWSNWDKVENGK